MAVVPSGLPAHARASSIETIGGHVDKKNYGGIGIVDPTTDESAEQFSRMVDIVQAVEKTAPFAVLNYRDGATPTVLSYTAMYGTVPTVQNAEHTGETAITWANSYTDSYGVTESFTIRHATAQIWGSPSSIYLPQVNVVGNQIYLQCWNLSPLLSSSIPVAIAGLTVTVSIW